MGIVETLTASGTSFAPAAPVTSSSLETRPERHAQSLSIISTLRKVLVLVAIASVAFGAYTNSDVVSLAFRELGSLTPRHVLLLIVVLCLHKLVSASLIWRSIPGLGFRQAIVTNEVYVGCSNATVGGFAVGTGVKVGLLRSRGVRESDIFASILWTSLVTPCCVWMFAGGFSVARVIEGTAQSGEGLVLGCIGGFIAVLFIGRLVVKCGLARSRQLKGASTGLFASLVGRFPIRLQRQLSRFSLCDFETRIGGRGLAVLRCRGPSMFVVALAAQVSLCTVMVACASVVNHADGVSWIDIAGTFALARAVGSVAPVPGGGWCSRRGIGIGFCAPRYANSRSYRLSWSVSCTYVCVPNCVWVANLGLDAPTPTLSLERGSSPPHSFHEFDPSSNGS